MLTHAQPVIIPALSLPATSTGLPLCCSIRRERRQKAFGAGKDSQWILFQDLPFSLPSVLQSLRHGQLHLRAQAISV
jgi:hypothetical protein